MAVALLIAWGGWQLWRVREQIHQQLASRHAKPSAVQSVQVSKGTGLSAAAAMSPQPISARNVPLSPAEKSRALLLYRAALRQLKAMHPISARNQLEGAWRMAAGHGAAIAQKIRALLSDIDRHTVLAGVAYRHDPWVRLVQMPAGSTPDQMAHLYRITPGLLEAVNPLLGTRNIEAGSWITVILGPFNAIFHWHAARVDIFIRHQFVISYALKVSALIHPMAGRYKLVRVSLGMASGGSLSGDLPDFVSIALRGRSDGRHEIIRVSNVDSFNSDFVMRTFDLETLAKLLNPTFSRISVRP